MTVLGGFAIGKPSADLPRHLTASAVGRRPRYAGDFLVSSFGTVEGVFISHVTSGVVGALVFAAALLANVTRLSSDVIFKELYRPFDWIVYLPVGEGANKPTKAPTAADPRATRTSGVVLPSSTSMTEPTAAIIVSKLSTTTAMR